MLWKGAVKYNKYVKLTIILKLHAFQISMNVRTVPVSMMLLVAQIHLAVTYATVTQTLQEYIVK